MVDPHFRDAFADWLNITRIAGGQPFDTRQDARTCFHVAQAVQPMNIGIGFADFKHNSIVAKWLHAVNAFQ